MLLIYINNTTEVKIQHIFKKEKCPDHSNLFVTLIDYFFLTNLKFTSTEYEIYM